MPWSIENAANPTVQAGQTLHNRVVIFTNHTPEIVELIFIKTFYHPFEPNGIYNITAIAKKNDYSKLAHECRKRHINSISYNICTRSFHIYGKNVPQSLTFLQAIQACEPSFVEIQGRICREFGVKEDFFKFSGIPSRSSHSSVPLPPLRASPLASEDNSIPQYLRAVATRENQLIERFQIFTQRISKAKDNNNESAIQHYQEQLDSLLGFARLDFDRKFPDQSFRM